MTPEGKVLNKVRKYLREQNIPMLRMVLMPYVTVGWPDIIIPIPGGITIFMELKAAGKKPDAKQQVKLDRLNELGHIALWFDNADEAISAIAFFLGYATRGNEPAEGGAKVSAVDAVAVYDPSIGVFDLSSIRRATTRPRRPENKHHLGRFLQTDGDGQGKQDAGDRAPAGVPPDVAG